MKYNFLLLFLVVIPAFLCAKTPALEKISVQLKWKHQFQFAGFYMAKEKGFYRDVGLDVTLIEYEHGQDIVQDVLAKKSEYGVGYPSIILDKTNHNDIVLLHALLQSSPHVLISLKDSQINSIADFKEKKIMIAGAATYTASFISMLRSHGVSMSDMHRLDPSFSVESLINKETDLMTAYSTNELFLLEKKGVAFRVWDPKNYGFDFYDDLLFTSKEELEKNPQRVKKFAAATLKGFEYAYAHKEESAKLIQKKYNTLKKTHEALMYEGKILEELAYANKTLLGEIDPVKIQRIFDIYNLFGHIKKQINLDEFIYTPQNDFFLNDKEREYIANKKQIRMCVDPNWMPFEEIKDGVYRGMSADYFELIKKKVPLEFTLIKTKTWEESIQRAQQRECDILSLVVSTPERQKYLRFTDAYLNIPLVMATKMDVPFVVNFESLANKRVAIPKGYAFLEILKARYPKLEIVEVENIQDGLQKVANGEIYGYIGALATIGYSLQKDFTGELKISGKFDESWNLGIGVRSDDVVLLEILQKAVRSISEKEKRNILNNWLAIKYENSIDYTLLFKAMALFAFVLIFVVLFYIRERKLKQDVEIHRSLLEAIINNIPNPMFYKNRAGIFENVNDAFSKNILGLQKNEVVGKSLDDLAGIVPSEVIVFHIEQDKQLYEDHNSLEYDTVVGMHDGSMKDFKITKTVFMSASGECSGYIGIMTDITEHKENEKRLQRLASIDPLTQLYNRRHFTTMANHLFHLALRHQEALSIVMLDIDNFKHINDTYGHKVGDDVIVMIANILQKMSRESDIVARFGGEEYILLLPKTSKEGAYVIAEKLREAVADMQIVLEDKTPLSCSVSLGVSMVDLQSEKDIEEAIKRADNALYNSKRSGKNRVS